ncbi:uncharacterized protein CTRU02_201126 [Colletotrichum truncatum]|uniref:Uncharacterized protein n=1 Tax=Colletotrichum truncatum TaxID=5467 RepID=A0ACC3ZGJ3_COLTU|nr:uncharacterized protein CTRU02_12439 [Colletotrichum truncatum]KAF6784734.1 hypothetical protein CTRU02_12439 [Colletotrichum truncatum]
MRIPKPLAIFLTLLAWVANADRKLPADLQVDLIFPLNETYAPTQWFPIIFDVQNLDALWPVDIFLSVSVWSNEWKVSGRQSRLWEYEFFGLSPEDFAKTDGPPPSKHFFHIPSINMTNGTTGEYSILWHISIENQCFANATQPLSEAAAHDWSNRLRGPYERSLQFSTAPGAQLPDIEATVNSCPSPNENNSVAVRITEVRETLHRQKPCPVFETNVAPARCAYKPFAAELAANVSGLMLGNMRCSNGTWQTVTAPCPRKSASNAHRMWSGAGWVPVLVVAAVISIL